MQTGCELVLSLEYAAVILKSALITKGCFQIRSIVFYCVYLSLGERNVLQMESARKA